MTTEVVAVTASGAFVVNGPEGSPDCDRGIYIRWRDAEDNVARLGQRIFKATQDGDFKKSRSLQKLMLRSLSNTLVSVRQVAQRNTGRRTAGIDGEVALTLPAVAQAGDRASTRRNGPGGRCRSSGCISRRPEENHAAPARYSCAHGPLSSGTCPARTGTRVGSPVRAPILWVRPVPAAVVRTRSRPSSPRCAARLLDGCGFWTPTCKRRSIESITTTDQVLLDPDRSAPVSQGRGLTLRSRFSRLLEQAAKQERAPAGSDNTAIASCAGRPLPALRGLPFARRPPASIPHRMGAVAEGHP